MNQPHHPPLDPLTRPRGYLLSWVLPGVALLWMLLVIPPVTAGLQELDRAIAWQLNGLLGHSRLFDAIMICINSKFGDKLVVLSFLGFFYLHSLYGKTRQERIERAAFWLWVIMVFVLIYQSQRVIEEWFDRLSPNKVLEGWYDLAERYQVHAKTSNTRSFPSGHGSAYWFFALMALRTYPRVGVWLVAIALLVPTTRVITGAHWLSDILLGSLPYVLVVATLMYDTPLVKTYAWAYEVARGLAHAVQTRHRRNWRERFRAAWKSFIR